MYKGPPVEIQVKEGVRPVVQPPRRTPLHYQELLREHIQELNRIKQNGKAWVKKEDQAVMRDQKVVEEGREKLAKGMRCTDGHDRTVDRSTRVKVD